MFVLCDDCRNHYDDLSQSPECSLGSLYASVFTAHATLHDTAVRLHVIHTARANRRAVPEPGRNRGPDRAVGRVAVPPTHAATDPAPMSTPLPERSYPSPHTLPGGS